MARSAITPETLAKARKLIAKGNSKTEAAALLGVGKSQLYERLGSGGGKGAAKKGGQPDPDPPRAAKAPRAPPTPPSTLDAIPMPVGIGTDDDLLILDEELVAARAARVEASADGNYGKVKPLVELIASLVKMRRVLAPPAAPTAEELEARSRPKAEEVMAKIRIGIRAVAKREAKTGCCDRCGGHLMPTQLEQRRAEAGIDEEAAPPEPAAPAPAPP